MAEGALKKLDRFIIDKVGTKIGFLYEDLVHECFAVLESQFEMENARMEGQQQVMEVMEVAAIERQHRDWTPVPVAALQPRKERVEQRRRKEKTRPAHSSVYEITPATRAEPPAREESAPPPRTFKVSASTAAVFSTLFDKTQSRGAVPGRILQQLWPTWDSRSCPSLGLSIHFSRPRAWG